MIFLLLPCSPGGPIRYHRPLRPRHTIEAAEHALKKYGGRSIHKIPTTQRLFQLRISLKEIRPEIWRRVQVKDCTLDRLHLHIQLAMGWEDYHLHEFNIDGVIYGDPELLCEGFLDDPAVIDSHIIKLSDIVPQDGSRLRFEYEYDFGDGWEHEILFEGWGRPVRFAHGLNACESSPDRGKARTENQSPGPEVLAVDAGVGD